MAPPHATANKSAGQESLSPKTPGPSYMNSAQVAGYLSELRSSRPARPSGARPCPGSIRSKKPAAAPVPVKAATVLGMSPSAVRAASRSDRLSARVTSPEPRSTMPAPGSEPAPSYTIPYYERGQRWTERQEVKSLRAALEDLDVAGDGADDEAALHAAAQAEASRLVWEHRQSGGGADSKRRSVRVSRDYKGHLRKGSHAQSQHVGPFETLHVAKPGAAASAAPSVSSAAPSLTSGSRSASGGSAATTTSSSSGGGGADGGGGGGGGRRRSAFGRRFSGQLLTKADPVPAALRINRGRFSLRRRSSKTPGQLQTSAAPIAPSGVKAESESSNGTVQAHAISKSAVGYETGSVVRRPFLRHAEALPPTPPDSAGNGASGEHNAAASREGLEVRGKDIVDATRGPRARSPNLPSPNFVSSRPDRPIVSFRDGYQPKADERVKIGGDGRTSVESCSQPQGTAAGATPSYGPRVDSLRAGAHVRPLPTVSIPELPDTPVEDVAPGRDSGAPGGVPMINEPKDETIKAPNVPIINEPSGPTINISNEPSPRAPAVPTIVAPGVPTISTSDEAPAAPAAARRPLPRPGPAASQPTRAAPSWARDDRARCTACALPIEGRTLRAADRPFHPACFACAHCGTGLECVAFYLEPDTARAERLKNAASGDTGVEAAPYDDLPRFYCHLDFHEKFSPRCRSCKTPIEGEVVLACGGAWHVGHFFCAECGDPFDAQTPFVEKNGFAWCAGCHVRRFSGKCAGCRKPVTEQGLQALGREWHVECFRCKECGSQFDDGNFFVRDESNDPYCVRCEERRLKA